MAGGGNYLNLQKNKPESCVLIWNGEKCDQKWFSDDFWSSKMATVVHFVKKNQKIKVAYWSEMASNAIKSDFRSSKMIIWGHFVKII